MLRFPVTGRPSRLRHRKRRSGRGEHGPAGSDESQHTSLSHRLLLLITSELPAATNTVDVTLFWRCWTGEPSVNNSAAGGVSPALPRIFPRCFFFHLFISPLVSSCQLLKVVESWKKKAIEPLPTRWTTPQRPMSFNIRFCEISSIHSIWNVISNKKIRVIIELDAERCSGILFTTWQRVWMATTVA